jgi:hypothetical protein
VTSDNSPHGYNLTFAFPMLLFIIIGGALYLVLTRPHTVPGHGELRLSGRTTESAHEAAGAHRAASADESSGNVSQDENQAAAAGPEPGDPSAPGSTSTAASTPDEDEASE